MQAVALLYNTILNRLASTSEITAWASRLTSGKNTYFNLLKNFVASSEARHDIQAAYLAAYQRLPLIDELARALANLSEGITMQQEVLSIRSDANAARTLVSKLIIDVYTSALQRAPLLSETQAMTVSVLAGRTSIEQIRVDVSNSIEEKLDVLDQFAKVVGIAPAQSDITNVIQQLQAGTNITDSVAQTVLQIRPYVTAIIEKQLVQWSVPASVIQGLAEPNAVVLITDRTSAGFEFLGSAAAQASGSWTFTYQAGLSPGLHEISVASYRMSSGAIDISTGNGAIVSIPAPSVESPAAIDTSSESAVAGGLVDATATLQAMADSIPDGGGVLRLQPGTYLLSHSLILKSGTELISQGATLVKSANWVWRADNANSAPCYALVTNAHFSLTSRVDHDITVEGISFDYRGFFNSGTHAISFGGVDGVRVEHSNFKDGNDGTAFLNSVNTLVNYCAAVGTNNAAFDSWAGSSNSLVENSTASIRSGYGILFNAVGTDGSSHNVANVAAIGNTVTRYNGSLASNLTGIWVSPLDKNSKIDNVTISNNNFVGMGSGIGMSGAVNHDIITGNSVQNGMWGPAVFARRDSSGTPDLGLVTSNDFERNTVSAGSVGEIQVVGSNFLVSGNQSTGSIAPALSWISGADDNVSGNSTDKPLEPLLNSHGSINLQTKLLALSDLAIVSPATVAVEPVGRMGPILSNESWLPSTVGQAFDVSYDGGHPILEGIASALQGLSLSALFNGSGSVIVDDVSASTAQLRYWGGPNGVVQMSDPSHSLSFGIGSLDPGGLHLSANANGAAILSY